MGCAADALIAVHTHDVVSRITVHDKTDGRARDTIELPGLGQASVTSRPDGGDDVWIGYTDFLTQAKAYEELLKEPHVGLALDPEWRLQDGERHMEQIGSVTAAEINEVSDWLARLTRGNSLPQKVLILHQFQLRMISNREQLETGHDELAVVIHADGHGGPGQKLETWRALRQDLPDDVWMGWKNFYDEDTPMFTPEETYAVEPRPWFVSYQ